MFDALADEPVSITKPASAAQVPAKATTKAIPGATKKTEVKREPQASSSLPVTRGPLPGEARREAGKGPRHKHTPRVDQEGKIRGREFDRHSGTGRPPRDNSKRGAGRANWGAVKDAAADLEAITSAPLEQVEGATTVEATPAADGAVVENADAAPKVEVVPEVKTQSLDNFQAEKAKKAKALAAQLGIGPRPEARKVEASWYKAPAAAPSKSTSNTTTSSSSAAATKEQKQSKKFVPVSAVVGEVVQREERRGPRRDNREGGNQENRDRRDGARREGNHSAGGRSARPAKKTFDATAGADSLPALGQ